MMELWLNTVKPLIETGHLKVRSDGTWIVDHSDDFNPDRGYPVEHFLADTTLGHGAKILMLGAATAMIVIAVGELLGSASSA